MKNFQLFIRIYWLVIHVLGTIVCLYYLADGMNQDINVILVLLTGVMISVLFVLVLYHFKELINYIRKNKQKPQKP
jgi:hypothetical protein